MMEILPSFQVDIKVEEKQDPREGKEEERMLERVWRKGNPITLLVGMQTSTATMENSVEIP